MVILHQSLLTNSVKYNEKNYNSISNVLYITILLVHRWCGL